MFVSLSVYPCVCVCVSGGSVLVCILHCPTDACCPLAAVRHSRYHSDKFRAGVCLRCVCAGLCLCVTCFLSFFLSFFSFFLKPPDRRALSTVRARELSADRRGYTCLPSQSGLRLCSSSPPTTPQLLPTLASGADAILPD